MYWLLSQEVARDMRGAIACGWVPTAEQQAAHEKQRAAEAAAGPPRGMTVAGNTAEIRIEGALTPRPDLFAMFFGGGNTTYAEIQAGLAAALADATIKNVILVIASPGGTVAGLFETLAALEALKASGKNVTVRASQAQSAAYAIAAVGGKIQAVSPASMFGSLGVAVSYFLDPEIVELANTESPNKRPDVSTPEGQDVVRQELDALYEIFADAIARGRGVKVDVVKSEFGRGSSFVAGDAFKRNMIDAAPKLRVMRADSDPEPNAAAGDSVVQQICAPVIGASKGKRPMTKEELKAQHKDVYEAILAEGRAEGQATERKRVLAHMKLGKNLDAMKIAEEAIASGASTLDEEVHADYMSAGKNKRDIEARQEDSDGAGEATGGAAPAKEQPKTMIDRFAAHLPPAKKKAR